jgi:hypothetical protein
LGLADSDHRPPPDVIEQENVEGLESALKQFRLIAGDLGRPARMTVTLRFPGSIRTLAELPSVN